ncbi:hypothetical protein [Mycolicibacterium sp. P9-22]|uniref:hypothetical protein n=1 Tax=Mycolicibacterium sp. P9-22 TaxID=2024613 RepID=UPI0011F00A4B|nr:hypothetical protein [Mycolicibacterium sp. P9-22]KAA0120479.1 hypothetical protein CIW51_03085 [Mycolicibacterium sp. P9-22]
MGAAREEFLRRTMVAGVASTVVISLTALTAGVAPAAADPEIVVTTTAQAPQESGGGQGRGGGRGSQEESPYVEPVVTPEAPAQTQAPVVTQAPVTKEPVVTQAPVIQAPVVTQAPVQTQEPVVTQAPVETPRVTVAPETVAPKPAPKPEPEPEPAVEQPTTTSTKRPSTQVTTSPAAPSAEAEPAPPTTAMSGPKPVEQEALTTGPSNPAPGSDEAKPSDRPTAEEDAPSSTDATESSAAAEPSEAETSKTDTSVTDTSAADEPQVENAAKVIETLKPEVLDAPVADVQLASSAKPVEVNPEPAKVEELAQLSSLVGVANERDRLEEERRQLREDQRELREDQRELREDQRDLRAEQRDWDRRVRQWSPDWVQYDEFYRPMIVNPYRDPVRIVYEYQNRPRVVTIAPLQRMVMYVADLAAYSFTAVVLNTINTVVSTAVGVAVGSFFGGGFIPNITNIGAIAPPPPPPLFRYDNVPVQVRYSDAVYEPFRVQRIVDVGDDARYGERRVLLDGVTPAWGVWKQNAAGERQFEIHRTQQYPGLDTPREGPLPGDYRMTLASEEAPSSTGNGQMVLIVAAVACAVLSLGAVAAAGVMGRRRGI